MKALVFTAILSVIVLSGKNNAQDRNYYSVTTWHITIPDDKSDAELNKLMKEFAERIAVQNGIQIKEKTLRGDDESNLRDYLLIKEYLRDDYNSSKKDKSESTEFQEYYIDHDAQQCFFETYTEEFFLEFRGRKK